MFNAIIATIVISLISLVGAFLLLQKKALTTTYGGIMAKTQHADLGCYWCTKH
jgi:hypothetical protein